MRFTPTTRYNSLAIGAYKDISWTVYVRITTALSGSNTAMYSWTEVTSKITSLPDFMSKLEFETGQFVADSIQLVGNDIDWWKTNIINPASASTDFIECGIKFTLGNSSDLVIPYSGFIDKNSLVCNEIKNSITFNVDTLSQIADRTSAETLVTQYIEPDVFWDGTGISGVIINSIIGLYAVTANTMGFPLKKGVHTLSFVQANPPTLSLDGGAEASLTNGYVMIGNGETTEKDSQRLRLAVSSSPELTSTPSFEDKIIVLNDNEVLPYQFYKNTNAKQILINILNKIGVSNQNINFDSSLEMNTWNGQNKISYLEQPPYPLIGAEGFKYTLASGSGYLWFGIGNKLYRRDTSSSSNNYALRATLTAGRRIHKLMYNQRNQHLWMFCSDGTSKEIQNKGQKPKGKFYLIRYSLTGNLLSNEVTLSTDTGNTISNYGIDIYDYNYSGTAYKYGVVYADEGVLPQGDLRFVNGSTLGVESIILGQEVEAEIGGTHYITSNFVYTSGDEIRFTTSPNAFYQSTIALNTESTGTWGTAYAYCAQHDYPYKKATYNSIEDRIYFRLGWGLYSHVSNNTSFTELGSNVDSDSLYSTTGGTTYISVSDHLSGENSISAIRNNSVTSISGVATYNHGQTINDLNGKIYGVDFTGMLWQIGNRLSFYVKDAGVFSDLSLFGALNMICNTFNLVCIINPYKKAYIFRRIDDSGNPVTTGNILTLNANRIADITENLNSYCKCDFVSVSNNNKTVTYNGINFNEPVLSDVKKLEITSELLDDVILEDVCYAMYQFYSINRILYTVPIPNIPYFQFEPLDACQLNFVNTNIQKSASGVIYDAIYKKNGSMEFKVLI